LSSRAAGVEFALKAVARGPMFGEQFEARFFDRRDRIAELFFRSADLREHEDDSPLGALFGELARQRQRWPQIVAGGSGWQEDDLAVLGEFLGDGVDEAAGVGNDEVDLLLAFMKLLETLERARV